MNNDLPTNGPPSRIFNVRPGLNPEETLTNASELLASAVSMGYQGAFELVGAQRDKALGILQLVEMAQMLVDQMLEQQYPTA
ncbi:DUF6124 family protein [Pseudomonas sp. 18175]|uniref:DUF6124 family protein n=1 Tax=Pseudomonas sp. 18175 TaxID=3390056 RepID=UPI003D1A2081